MTTPALYSFPPFLRRWLAVFSPIAGEPAIPAESPRPSFRSAGRGTRDARCADVSAPTGNPLQRRAPPRPAQEPPLKRGDRPSRSKGPLLAPRPRLAARSLARQTLTPRPRHGQSRPTRVTAPDTCESGDCCVWQPSSEVHRLGSAFPLVSPKRSDQRLSVSRKPLLVAPGVPLCLVPHRDAFGGPRASAAYSLRQEPAECARWWGTGAAREAGRLEPRVGGDLLLVSRESRGAGSHSRVIRNWGRKRDQRVRGSCCVEQGPHSAGRDVLLAVGTQRCGGDGRS